MSKLELIATATFGLEAVVRREIEALGYKVLKSEDAKITYLGDESAVVKSNLWLRTADRVLLCVGQFMARSFEELFQQTRGLPWEEWIPFEGRFPVSGTSVKSVLHSVPDCQAIVKKAIVERLKEFYGGGTTGYSDGEPFRFPETGADYAVKVTLLKNQATITLDTSGTGLHKRGYRVQDVAAPMKETLAAALVQLSFWKAGRLLVDPFCGSGTIPIEAAMVAANMAPGLSRHFAAEKWEAIPAALWKAQRKAAFSSIHQDADIRILASDLSPSAVEAARENALEAGVDQWITFSVGDAVKSLKAIAAEERGNDADGAPGSIVICNPPYGERIGEKAALERLYGQLGAFFGTVPAWSLYLITADKEFEQVFGRAFAEPRQPDRRRKLYNGRIETCYYQYYGKKPGLGTRLGQKGCEEGKQGQ